MESVKDKIIKSINYVTQEMKWTLVNEDWGSVKNKCTCAMGCVILMNNPSDMDAIDDSPQNAEAAAEILEVSEDWIDSFCDGFDDNPDNFAKDAEGFKLGKEIAALTKPINSSSLKK